MGVVTGSIVVNARAATVLDILLNLEAYPTWQGGIDRIDVKEVDDQGRPTLTQWHVRAMGHRATHAVRYEYPEREAFEYHLVESEVLTKYDFSCAVTTNDDGTSEVTLSQELGIKWKMPERILDKHAKKGINSMLTALKEKVDQRS
ncbi:SRPBCC family protein [Amycolatopsis suaedae]|uniref:SRPBCC family protein n=1 Tax=Amycolatopsis suaedae TaxID=2510978 RepID=A0A4Q7J0X4_9PSEU|nr:SRPBCC family protein [Amycolatopsis suaedae]RZQ61020.1 hypothetical protein EWH70_26520 [Amycolatopsis suaedae]